METGRIMALLLFFILLPLWALYFTRNRSKDLEGYVLGGRVLGPVATAFTAAAAATSAGLFVGGAGMAYQYGWGGATWQIGAFIGCFISWFIMAPKIREVSHKIKAVTAPELFAKRYASGSFHPIVAFWIVIFTIPMLIVQMRSAALTMETYLNIPYFTSLIIFSVVLIIVSALGGRIAIAYLSTAQGLIMIIGTTAALIYALVLCNGIGGIDKLLSQQDPSLVTFFGEMPRSLWYNLSAVYLFGLFSGPHVIPSFYGMKDGNTARLAFPIGVVISLYWTVAAIYIGLVPRALGIKLDVADKALAVFSTQIVPPIIGILIILCLLAAVFTTLDTLLMAAGSSIIHDVIGKIKKDSFDHKQELLYTRIATIIIGALGFILSLIEMPMISILNGFAFGAFVICIGIPMVLGLFWKKANRESAFFSTVLGPIIYIIWKYYLVGITGMGELPGTVLVVTIGSIIISMVKPASDQQYFIDYQNEYFLNS
jgi:sodium/pantothenate symporter